MPVNKLDNWSMVLIQWAAICFINRFAQLMSVITVLYFIFNTYHVSK